MIYGDCYDCQRAQLGREKNKCSDKNGSLTEPIMGYENRCLVVCASRILIKSPAMK